MNCETTSRKLSAYLDDELPPPERQAVEQHLADCPLCRRQLAGLRALAGPLAQLEGTAPPADFARRVRRLAQRRRPAEQQRSVRLTWFQRAEPVLVRAAAALLAVAGLWLGTSMARTTASTGSAYGRSDDLAYELETLSAAPPGSLADAYMAVLEQTNGGSEG